MPNTPALIGQGIAGVFARPAVTDEDRIDAEGLLAATGELVWVGEEAALDAVTALSGSGPAYVFMLLEALQEAGRQMGLPTYAARRLAEQTVAGSAALAAASAGSRPPSCAQRHLAGRNDRGGGRRSSNPRGVRDELRRRGAGRAREGRGARQAHRSRPRSTLLPPP